MAILKSQKKKVITKRKEKKNNALSLWKRFSLKGNEKKAKEEKNKMRKKK